MQKTILLGQVSAVRQLYLDPPRRNQNEAGADQAHDGLLIETAADTCFEFGMLGLELVVHNGTRLGF